MWHRLNIIATIMLVNVFVTNITSIVGTQSSEEKKKELLQDMAQVRAIGKNNELENLEKFAVELERKWFARKKEHYGYMILEICGKFSSLNFKDDRQYDLARHYAILALGKSGELEERDKIPIEVELKLVTGHIQSLYKFKEASKNRDWTDQRSSLAKLYFHAWHRLEKSIDPNEAVPPWPKPSGGDGIWFSGMSPESIKDPVVRAEYKAELKKFWQKMEWYNNQRRLRKLKKYFLPRLQKQVLRLYSGPLFDCKKLETEALQRELEKHIKDKRIRAMVFDSIRERFLEETKEN